eukprot:GEMP01004523.1.p1 GENE.GEMP01004523.1~~GEMP01004523.1.p1  ORF type:complete len:485 (+),score=54.52 GEMP01004523.1:191-1456(+)
MTKEKTCGAFAWIKNLPIAYIGLLMGALTGVASSFLNVTLSINKEKLGDPILAALLMYMSALILSAVILPSPVAACYSSRQNDTPKFAWWMCLSGVCGVVIVTLIAYVAALLPLVLVTLSYNIGQLLGSFTTDHFGFLGTPKRRFNKRKLCSLFMFAAGLLLFSVKDNALQFQVETLVLVAAGMLAAVQSSINRCACEALPYKVQAIGIQFLSGFLVLSIVWTFKTVINTRFEVVEHLPWYLFMIPALLNFPIIFNYFFFAPKVGMALFAMVAILSEITTSLIVDSLQVFTANNVRPFSIYMGLGMTAAIVGTALTAFAQVKWGNGADMVLKHIKQVDEQCDACSTDVGEDGASETEASETMLTTTRCMGEPIQLPGSGTGHLCSLSERLQRGQDEEQPSTRNCIEGNEGNSTEDTICEIV